MLDLEIQALESAVEQIWEVARGFGLDPYPTNFEIVPAPVMYEVGSYALPGRYSHWTFGKAYHRMKTMYDFGLSKIYEVVINTNPAYGFLLETNSPIQNKMVIAHVLGHVDFFKNNTYFSKTNRRMVESVSTHAQRMMEYEFKYGRKTVERFLDAVLAIEEHIDPYFFIKRDVSPAEERRRAELRPKDGRYDDLWLLDRSEREARQLRRDEQSSEQEKAPRERLPEKDLLFYIMKNSPTLSGWQRDAIAMVHEEMEYFVPQMQTKIMNEGWASIWHARIMRELDLSDNEHIEFANLHSGVVSPHKGQLNPYYLGYKIYEDIERRWNEPSAEEQKRFGRKGNEGHDKIFEVRELENDVSFLRNYLTEENAAGSSSWLLLSCQSGPSFSDQGRFDRDVPARCPRIGTHLVGRLDQALRCRALHPRQAHVEACSEAERAPFGTEIDLGVDVAAERSAVGVIPAR